MKSFISILLTIAVLASAPAFAHSDGSHRPISEAQALTVAADAARQLSLRDSGLEFGKLPASWAAIPRENVAMSKVGQGFYIVAVENKSEQQTLYVLMSISGEVYDANFTGLFEGID